MSHFTMPCLPVIRQRVTLAELVYMWALNRLGML
jgi:hypothetical protein